MCRITRLKQRPEGIRYSEDLLLQRSIEHHRNRTADTEQVPNVRQAYISRLAHPQHTRNTGIRPRFKTGHRHQKPCRLPVRNLRIANPERHFRRHKYLEPLRTETEIETALQPEKIGIKPRRTQTKLTDKLYRKAIRLKFESPRNITAVGTQPRQRKCLDFHEFRHIHLKRTLAEHEDTERLQFLEVRL